MHKNLKGKIISLILVLIMVLGLFPASAAADEDITVVVSFEGLTLGQGFYVKPEAYTLSEINALIAEEGYGPYSADELTASMATLAMIVDKGLDVKITGDYNSQFYLSAVKDFDNGDASINPIIGENGGPTDDDNTGNDDDYLGEFDYGDMSGWMITVNNVMINVGASEYALGDATSYQNTYVIRWQFTVNGYGADLGYSTGWGNNAYFDGTNKDMLYAKYALSNDSTAKAAALPVMENLTASQSEINEALLAFGSEDGGDPQGGDPQGGDPQGGDPQGGDPVVPGGSQSGENLDVSTVLNDTLAQMAKTVTAPGYGTSAGEWSVLCLARGGYYEKGSKYFEDYYSKIVDTVNTLAPTVASNNGALHSKKSTDNSRLILALSAIGKDATKVGNWNLITPYDNFEWIPKQGINGAIFALIALDTHGYETTDKTIRTKCVDYILDKELEGGGWTLSGNIADPDITAMALQALVNYRSDKNVQAASERAFDVLSAMQQSDGGFSSWGTANSESISQVITATTAWGINPDTDPRFIKNGISAVDALLSFYSPEEKMFKHELTKSGNDMATDQGAYALIAYDRFCKGKNSLYDMSDVSFGNTPSTPTPGGNTNPGTKPTGGQNESMSASLIAPTNIGNGEQSFNATVALDRWDNTAGYKLIDFILSIPKGLSVTSVSAGARLSGGEVSYHLEQETGKLRVVYFDAANYSDIKVSGTSFPAEMFTVGLTGSASKDNKLPLALLGMSVKLGANPLDPSHVIAVSTSGASGNIGVVDGISISALTLYQGDGVDVIPADKKAIAILISGIPAESKVHYNDGVNAASFYYSPDISLKKGVSAYVSVVDASIEMSNFIDTINYTFPGGTAPSLSFGNVNTDTVINAQDALAAVNAWLRKGDAPTDIDILTLNVNGDSRINTYDALGIVEAFVNQEEFIILSKLGVTPANG